jgi:hypothetical protein
MLVVSYGIFHKRRRKIMARASLKGNPGKAKGVAAFVVSTAATIAILSFANSASAVPLTWAMAALFDDGGNATGTFTYDADTNTYLDFNISVAGGNTTSFPPFTYSPATSSATGSATGLNLFAVPSLFLDRFLFMDFGNAQTGLLQPLTDAGGFIPIMNPLGLGGVAETNQLSITPPFFAHRGFTEGFVLASPVPGPIAGAGLPGLILACGVLLALAQRRRQKIA